MPRLNHGPATKPEKSEKVTQFIRWYDDALSADICQDIVDRFDNDARTIVGKVSGNQGPETDLSAKQTTELIIPQDGWGDIIAALQQSLSVGLGKYQADVKFLAGSDHRDLHCEPLRIKRYDIGGQFSWHIDCNSAQN
ncbi:MAG: hypothetical protein ACR2OM_10940, partial [Aestuariivirgaceae bacterium]